MDGNTIAAAWLMLAGAALAADITWGPATDYAAPSDVRTDGVLVEAINASGEADAADLVINGVPFTADTTLLNNDATTNFLSGDTGDTAYNQFLNSLDYGTSGTLQIGGGLLETGKEYLVQAWFVDERSSSDARAMQFGDGNGNLSPEVNDQHVTGTFVADGGSQTFIVYGVTSGPHFTGYQLRDLSSPVPTLSTTAGGTVAATFSLTIEFSESVTGLDAGDFTTVNCAVSNVSGGGTSWSAEVTPAGNGDLRVSLPAGAVLDADNHGNAASNTILTTHVAPGSDQPVPTLSTTAADVTGDYTVDIDFSEPVTGLELTDFAVSGATLSNLTGSGNRYSFVVSPNFGGNVTVSLPRNSVTDTDGDGLQNPASNELVNAYFITVTVNSPEQLLPYLTQDNVTATLTPGTYTIDADDVQNTYGTPRFEFRGSNSTYDFTGVTLNFAADIYQSGLSMSHMQVFGNNNVLKNLRMIDLCDKYGTAGLNGGVNLVVDGESNRIEGFYFEIRGSYPYGYGDCFGKGATYTIKHWKHSGLLVRGNYNHILNCTLMQQSYGHCIFMQAASHPTIEGCYVEAETRTTDDMLAETSGPAFDIDFMTVWGFRLPPGYMKATCEGGIRAYNAGNTYVNGVWYSRGTDNPTILNNTLVNTRTGVTLTHASGTKVVSGCTTLGTERGYAIGSGIIENCYSDVKHGPAFGVDYASDSGITADITIIPHEGAHYNGDRHVAYITGSNHKLTFRSTVQNPEQDLQVNMGGDRNIISDSQAVEDYPADNIVINNLTGYPLVLDDNTSANKGQSIGTVTNAGTTNSIATQSWDVLNNLAFLGKATQSSDAYDTIASIATDQNTDGIWSNGSVTHTNTEDQPWWKIDLHALYDISEIRIWGRTDSNQSRLSDYDVTILDENGQAVWSEYQAGFPDPFVSLLPNANGRYLMIQLRGTNALSLAEVEIFGDVFAGPSGLTATSGTSTIELGWNAVADASEYTVKRATASGGPYITLATTSGTTFTDHSALSGTIYYYVVTATVDGEESSPGNEAAASFGIVEFQISSADITASTYQDPNIPANTVDGNIGTRWSAKDAGQWIRYDLGSLKNILYLEIAWLNGNERIATFDVEVSDDDITWTPLATGLQNSGTTAELETIDVPDTLARYLRIVGYGNTANTWNSITEVAIWGTTPTPPPVPADLAATAGNGRVTLSWTVSDGATVHHLKRAGTSDGEFTTIASETGGSFTDTDVTNGMTYHYVVSAGSTIGESAESPPVSAKPYAPISAGELAAPAMTRAGDATRMTVESVLGRIYQLQRSATLGADDWEDVGEPTTGTGAALMLADPAPLDPKCFYRLRIEP
ncbi:MAG: discoidin domain-containing protein [Verrucomicrobiota bacterium JB025]|nr:discoidin domain-containing protein [Verrucomicrobiota bacterium JB025]